MSDPHRRLRADVRLLGRLLGDTLRAHEGEELFKTVERVRRLAKGSRAGHARDGVALERALAGLSGEAATPVARAFAHFLNLANIAEQHHRVRRRRTYLSETGAAPQRGSCDETFGRLLEEGLAPEVLYRTVTSLRIEIVLTAHPTEVVRRTLTQKYNRIAALLTTRDRSDLTEPERAETLASLRREIEAAWGTDEVRQERPTPLDEVRSGLVVFEESLWSAVPRYLRALDRALQTHTGQSLPLDAAPIRFGSWIGGDRDGNPNVTPDVTRRACWLARWQAAVLYLEEVRMLRSELSISHASDELRSRAGDAREPYRAVLAEVRDRLAATRDHAALVLTGREPWQDRSDAPDLPPAGGPSPYEDEDDLAEPLWLCHRSLEATGYHRLAAGRLADTLRRLTTFGLTLTRLDIRQHAARHAQALGAMTRAVGLGDYTTWDEAARLEFLVRQLTSGQPVLPAPLEASADVVDVLDTFRMLATMAPSSLGAYVISTVTQPSDVLVVELLQRESGLGTPLRVVPLFETAEALREAGRMLTRLLSIPWYRERIGGRQEVMVGYSDSAKEMGRFSAAWELYKAQEQIVDACRTQGVEVTLFHGRGGSVGRGGGPTYLAIQSQPSGSVEGSLRVTEQGEMVQAMFGVDGIALRTMEVYTSATLEASLRPATEPTAAWRDGMEHLSSVAREAYRELVYETPRFVEYFLAATPVQELTTLNIGSRPARRTPGTDIGSLRAIPWQFAWTQSRLLLASWLGLERALEEACTEPSLPRSMYRHWPFFRSTLDLMEMVLAKADARIAAHYDRHLVPKDLQGIGDDLRERLGRAIDRLRTLVGHTELLEDNTVLRRSIDVRNPYVDPINLVQVELLRRLRSPGETERARLRHAFVVTANGIAAGMRNTG